MNEVSPNNDTPPTKRHDDSRSLDALCKQFSTIYSEELLSVSLPIEELTRNQGVILETMQHENDNFADIDAELSLEDMFKKISEYLDKLVNIKKDMVALHEKATKLKKRAIRVKDIAEKQNKIPGK